MSVRSRALPRRVAAAACALFLLPVLATAVFAADPLQLQARALVAGRFEEGGWLGVAVSLTNDAQPVSGFVVADGQDGPVRRAVELPAGARKQVTLYLRPNAFLRTVEIRFENSSGDQLASASADVKVLEHSAATVALFGDPQGSLRAQVARRGDGLAQPIGLTAADLPERPEPLAGIEAMVWAGDSATLSEAQRRSIERWVAGGGDLIVLGGPDWQSRTAAFGSLLPVSNLSAIDDAPLTELGTWATAALPEGADTATVAAGQPRADAYELVAGSGQALMTARNSGAGRVIFVGVDLATAPFSGWDGAASFWSRLLPDDRLLQQLGGPDNVPQQVDAQMSQALANLPSLQVPPAELLLGVIVAYILLIGPVSYVVLRRFDRRELAWITAPALVIVFSAGSYGIGSSVKGSDVIVNEVSIVRTASEATAASVSTYAGVFSPGRETYDLTVRGEALISSLTNVFDGSSQAVGHVTEQGDPAHLRGLAVSVFGLQGIRAETVVPYQPSLQVSWHYDRRTIVGNVTNTSKATLSDVAVLADGGATMIGDLAPGASSDFSVSLGSFDGSQPSDRVYGLQTGEFAGTQRDLQVLTRRQVIDSLMNAAGIFEDKFGSIATLPTSGGPYVVGWHDDGAPVEVEVDDQKVQRFSQSVEVLAGRPSLGPGEVTLDPGDLDVEVVATAGDVNTQDAIATLLGNGSVDFRISLPLEASRLRPASLTIITGSDPSSILFDQRNANSPLPPGFRVSAFDVRARAWIELGDPNLASRFDVEQPDRFIGSGNSLLVRISGDAVPLEQGQSPVFATASLTGVIDR